MGMLTEEKALVILAIFGRSLNQKNDYDSQKSLILRGIDHDYEFSDLMEGINLCVDWGWLERRTDDLLKITEKGLLISPR